MNRRSARIFVLLILLLIAGGTIVAICMPRESLLMTRATRVADTRSWATPQYYYSWIESLDRKAALYTAVPSDRSPPHYYRWINDHELLFFREKSRNPPRVANAWNFYKLDTLTDRETSLTALSRLVQDSFDGSSEFAISPNGKRFFWTGNGITVTTLNAELPIRLDKEETGSFEKVVWTRDSNHLIVYSTKLEDDRMAYRTLYDIETQKAMQRLTFDRESIPHAITPDNRLLTAIWKPMAKSSETEDTSLTDMTEPAEIDESEIGKETQSPHKYSFLLPHKSCGEKMYFSPQGDHIAWQLLQPAGTLPPLLAWLHRLIPAYHPSSSPTKISLWVSRLDGSQMHEIGYVLLPTLPNGSAIGWELIFDHISWLPDGKRLSFRHDGALYTVPAD